MMSWIMIDSQNHSNDKIHRQSNFQSSAVWISQAGKKYEQFFEAVSIVTELEDMEYYRNHLEQSKATEQNRRNATVYQS